MALRSDILSKINQVQNAQIALSEEIVSVRDALASGVTGTDVNGATSITYTIGGVTQTVPLSTANSFLTQLQETYTQATTNLNNLQGQLNLASTVETINPRNPDPTVLRNYQHATRIFTDGQFRLSPKYGFLFYVEFDFNPLITNLNNTVAQEMGMIVKSINLPKFTIDVKQHNAYNRKNYVQNAIKYDPVNIVFHDDQSDNVLNFWYDYYSYYYRDPDYADATYQAYTKYQSRPTFDWGYSPRPSIGYNTSNGPQPYQYIQAVRIYSLYQGQFDEYELVNPIITSFKHGELANGENTTTLQHEMSLQFETVKYQTGYVTTDTVGGFVDLHYDNTPSPNGTQSGETAPGTFPTVVTDFANNSTAVNPMLRTDQALRTNSGFGISLGSALSGATSVAASTTTNSGGFSIPSFGSVISGIPSGAQIGQTLQAGAINIVGASANRIVGSVASGIAGGLGPNGNSILGLTAAAIANPSGALSTVENMATQYAMGIASGVASNLVGQASGYIARELTSTVSGAIGDLGLNNLATQAQNFISTNIINPIQLSAALPSGVSTGDYYNSLNGFYQDSTGTIFDSTGSPIGDTVSGLWEDG
jgi:hypothetical protein